MFTVYPRLALDSWSSSLSLLSAEVTTLPRSGPDFEVRLTRP